MLKGDIERLQEQGKTDKEIAVIASNRCPDNDLLSMPEDVKETMLNTADGPNPIVAKIDISDLKYKDLKKKAKQFGLKASGKKDELVARITAYLKEGK